jgi:homocitrate synthase NifV
VSRFVTGVTHQAMPPWKAIVGANAFRHEAGIHADGVMKDPETYEPFAPETVGAARAIVLGKHSGRAGVVHVFREMGVEITPDEARRLLAALREARSGGRPPDRTSLLALLDAVRHGERVA